MSDSIFAPPPPPGGASSYGAGVVPCTNGIRLWATILDGILFIVTCGIGWLIWDVILWGQASSPAKKMLNLKIVDIETGMPATMTQMLLREGLGKIVLGALTGVVGIVSAVLILSTPSRQGVWDYIAKTTVVREA